MPESSCGFRRVAGVRTFGDLIAHIANVQSTLCGNINGHRAHKATTPASKDNVTKDLRSSSQECETAFDELSAQTYLYQLPMRAKSMANWLFTSA